MAFYTSQFMPYARQSGELIVELNSRLPVPAMPHELSSAVHDDQFAHRMETMKRHLQRYSWSMFEKVFLFIATAISFIIPWPIMLLSQDIFGKIDVTNNPTNGFGEPILTEDQLRKIRNARFISFGLILGVFLLLWGPFTLFKSVGFRRRRALLNSWTTEDCAPPRPQTAHLQWNFRTCSTFHGRAQIAVSLPVHAWGGVSNFHPQAYLPEYIMAAEKGAFAPPQGPPPPRGSQEYMDEKV